jgi:cellulose synthase/poly-beta-1,6-N-acetylglucosamine synthase-like glycosyltransferase
MAFIVVTFVFLTLYYILACVYLYNGLLLLQGSGEPQELDFSVVIAAHNEAGVIGRCLESVAGQTLPAHRFEIIVVDDRSDDRTAEIVGEFSARRSNVKLVSIAATPPGIAPKKHAVSEGIGRAANEVVVVTDADCVVPPTWLETIDRNFSPGVGVVQGITSYEKIRSMNPFFFGLQAIDFISHGIVAAAAMGAGFPLNSNANNLSFRKRAFLSAGKYGEARGVVSGDDDLLVQRVWKRGLWEVRFMADPKGAVTTRPTKKLNGVLQQRKRWASKTVYYNKKQAAFLAGVFAFYCALISSFALIFWKILFVKVALFMLGAKLVAEGPVMISGLRRFGRLRLLPLFPVASLLQLPLVLYSVAAGVFGRFEWKGRRYSREAGKHDTAAQ